MQFLYNYNDLETLWFSGKCWYCLQADWVLILLFRHVSVLFSSQTVFKLNREGFQICFLVNFQMFQNWVEQRFHCAVQLLCFNGTNIKIPASISSILRWAHAMLSTQFWNNKICYYNSFIATLTWYRLISSDTLWYLVIPGQNWWYQVITGETCGYVLIPSDTRGYLVLPGITCRYISWQFIKVSFQWIFIASAMNIWARY